MSFRIELELRGGAKFCIIESVSSMGWIGAGTDVDATVDGWPIGGNDDDGSSLDNGLVSGFCTIFSSDIEFIVLVRGCDSFSKNLTKASPRPLAL